MMYYACTSIHSLLFLLHLKLCGSDIECHVAVGHAADFIWIQCCGF